MAGHDPMNAEAPSGDAGAGGRRFEIEGRSLGYPTRFRDGSSAVGLFLVPSRGAARLISESGFEVAEVAPGRAILSLACVHYRDSDCDVYNEISLAFFVKKLGQASGIPYLGTWRDIVRGDAVTSIWKLPVTWLFPGLGLLLLAPDKLAQKVRRPGFLTLQAPLLLVQPGLGLGDIYQVAVTDLDVQTMV